MVLKASSLPLPQNVSAALCHRHHRYHPRNTHRLHCLGEIATVAPCLRYLYTPRGLRGTSSHSRLLFMPFFPVHYHPHLNLFAAWDALIIPATLSPNGMDINIYLNPLTCALRPAALCDWFDRATLRFHWLSSPVELIDVFSNSSTRCSTSPFLLACH